ncbi:anaerobic C4-dicarboxylate transporter [Campylobacter sp. RM12640]|uniref:anaerobic C4-dicarboxylate transporter n=1 Tax=unclassified Campylobacter TaxID=2593542 RepID=UPI003014B106|nr:anaerobic C4-dicarboxylate transporter [Campylobacter sp. RM12640]MBZ7988251.1 anaerobic C4-dicarboxylate transporter [Campylobacter sp. RM12635]
MKNKYVWIVVAICFLLFANVVGFLDLAIVLAAIFLGVRLGGIAIGYTGGIGVILLGILCGIKPGEIPTSVILIIMSVIAAISAMQLAGGLDYLVHIAEKILRKNPKKINYLAPSITYFLTILAGTGHTAFSMIPVIVEVAKEQNIKPKAPLSLAVVSSQIAITASPVSAAVVYLSGVLEPFGYSYLTLLSIWIGSTYLACMLSAFLVTKFSNLDLSSDEYYQELLQKGEIAKKQSTQKEIIKGAKTSVAIFVIGVLAVVCYATYISGLKADKIIIPRDSAIMCVMLSIATFIVLSTKINTSKIIDTSVFKSGMNACVCVLGVAWLGDTYVSAHSNEIKEFAKGLVEQYQFLLAFAFFFASMLLYSQAATAKAIVPSVIVALALNENPENAKIIIASFAAVSALFVLPTYPTLLGAVGMDDTKTTRIGKYVFNHSFFIPGVLMIALSVALGFLFVKFI